MSTQTTDQTPRTAAELASAYLAALQAKDRPAIMAMVADGFTLEVPYDPFGKNDGSRSWVGNEAAAAGYDDAFKVIEDLVYVDVEVIPAQDPNIAFVEGWGKMKMANGRPYLNRYIFRFDAENGKLKRIKEFINPVTSALAWGGGLAQAEPL